MLHTDREDKTNISVSTPNSTNQALVGVSPLEPPPSRAHRFWRSARRYPIPLGSVLLLAASLILWLTGRGDIANWALLAVVLLGGILLLWETLRQFARKEFSVDVIAILAIAGSVWLGEYLAGAFVS
jgi:cation transport ATPase